LGRYRGCSGAFRQRHQLHAILVHHHQGNRHNPAAAAAADRITEQGIAAGTDPESDDVDRHQRLVADRDRLPQRAFLKNRLEFLHGRDHQALRRVGHKWIAEHSVASMSRPVCVTAS
jgi:hypothetical protein